MSQSSPNSERTILIASSGQDRPAWGPVAQLLEAQGYDVVPYLGDAVASGRYPFDVVVDNANGLTVNYNGRALLLGQVAAAWYGRPNHFVPETPEPDVIQRHSIDAGRTAAQEIIWRQVPKEAWINPPNKMRDIQHVLGQLALAREVGMTIPTSAMTDNWSTVNDLFPGDVVFKAPDSAYYTSSSYDAYVIYPTRIVPADRKSLTERANPFPGYWQEPLQNIEREWHVVVIGSRTFDVALYPPNTPGNRLMRVRYALEQFPDDYKQKCFDFLAKAELRHGVFKFIETSSGIIILEFAANSRLGWFEKELNLPISQTIADELAAIAHRNRP